MAGAGEFVCHPSNLSTGTLKVPKAFKCPSGDGAISEPKDMAGTDLAIKIMLDRPGLGPRKNSRPQDAEIQSIPSYW